MMTPNELSVDAMITPDVTEEAPALPNTTIDPRKFIMSVFAHDPKLGAKLWYHQNNPAGKSITLRDGTSYVVSPKGPWVKQ